MPRKRRLPPPKVPIRPARRAFLLTGRADPRLAQALLDAHRLDPGGPLTPDLRHCFADARARARRTGEPLHLVIREMGGGTPA